MVLWWYCYLPRSHFQFFCTVLLHNYHDVISWIRMDIVGSQIVKCSFSVCLKYHMLLFPCIERGVFALFFYVHHILIGEKLLYRLFNTMRLVCPHDVLFWLHFVILISEGSFHNMQVEYRCIILKFIIVLCSWWICFSVSSFVYLTCCSSRFLFYFFWNDKRPNRELK